MAFLLGFVFGLLFVPVLLVLVFLHAYFTLPIQHESCSNDLLDPRKDSLRRPGDDDVAIPSATDELAAELQRRGDPADGAAGYFAVSREYTPMGLNGKPPERTTPAGQVIAVESPSVYQSMYRSIFERKEKPTIEPKRENDKPVKRARNIFFVVLEHGHLMLYEDKSQMDPLYVISLEQFEISIWDGSDQIIPESELWVKRNAIRLSRKPVVDQKGSDPPPFFLFSENMSEKEDFYFAMLRNQEKLADVGSRPPSAQQFETKHIIKLVQVLHSSEEHLQTRAINALINRIFLALYKTPEAEQLLRKKITKKIARVQRPNFITRIALEKIDAGEGAPFFTKPHLKDLNISGDTCLEADVEYNGNFKIEVAATARIDISTKLKPREVEMLLAVVVKKVSGHAYLKIKPSPSNRVWFTFSEMPRIDLDIQPIVSSRQITYGIILRTIESTIMKTVAETLVLPYWDDTPFLDTASQKYRGGIWKNDGAGVKSTEIQQEDTVEDLHAEQEKQRVMTMPSLPVSPQASVDGLKARGKSKTLHPSSPKPQEASSTSVDKLPSRPPKAMRSESFSNPTVTTTYVSADNRSEAEPSPRKDAKSTMMEISSKSLAFSPPVSPSGSPPKESVLAQDSGEDNGNLPSSQPSEDSNKHSRQPSETPSVHSVNQLPASSGKVGTNVDPNIASLDVPKRSNTFASMTGSLKSMDRKQTINSIGSATAVAKKWSWGMLNRNDSRSSSTSLDARPGTPEQPIGRGRPLPPPGVPLPPPEKQGLKYMQSLTKRKPVPPPQLPERPGMTAATPNGKPPLPERRKRQSVSMSHESPAMEEVMVVEAPRESAPSSPVEVNEEKGEREGFFGEMEQNGEPSKGPVEEELREKQDENRRPPGPLLPPRTPTEPLAEDMEHEETRTTEMEGIATDNDK